MEQQIISVQQDAHMQAFRRADNACKEGVHRVGEQMVRVANQSGITEKQHALAFIRMFESKEWEKVAFHARLRCGKKQADVHGIGQEKMLLKMARQFGMKDEKRVGSLFKELECLFWEKVAIKATYDAQLVSLRAKIELPLLQTDSSDNHSNDDRGTSSDDEESELEDHFPTLNKNAGGVTQMPSKEGQETIKPCATSRLYPVEEEKQINRSNGRRVHKFKVGARVYLHQKVGLGPVTPSGPGKVIEQTRDAYGNPTYTIGEIFTSFRKTAKNAEESLVEHYSVNQERPKRPRPTYPKIDDL